jgi:hypothetical protein
VLYNIFYFMYHAALRSFFAVLHTLSLCTVLLISLTVRTSHTYLLCRARQTTAHTSFRCCAVHLSFCAVLHKFLFYAVLHTLPVRAVLLTSILFCSPLCRAAHLYVVLQALAVWAALHTTLFMLYCMYFFSVLYCTHFLFVRWCSPFFQCCSLRPFFCAAHSALMITMQVLFCSSLSSAAPFLLCCTLPFYAVLHPFFYDLLHPSFLCCAVPRHFVSATDKEYLIFFTFVYSLFRIDFFPISIHMTKFRGIPWFWCKILSYRQRDPN